MTTTITAVPKFVLYTAKDYAVLKCKLEDGSAVTVVGNVPDTINLKMFYSGSWETSKYGKQFHALTYEAARPTNKTGFVAYMKSLKCGIGKQWAERIYAKFGDEAWDVINTEPEKLLTMKNFGANRMMKLKNAVKETLYLREIIETLSGFMEISLEKAKKILDRFKSDSVKIIKEDPYRLLSVSGFGFATVDMIGRHFGADPDDRLRVEGAIMAQLERNEVYGNTCMPREELIKRSHRFLNRGYSTERVSRERCEVILSRLLAELKCRAEDNDGMIFTKSSHESERDIAINLKRISSHYSIERSDEKRIEKLIERYNTENHIVLDVKQCDAVKAAFSNGVSIMTGGPGTGKTSTLKAILYIHRKLADESIPLLVAPSARAARRMSESTGYPAQTIHSAIGLRPNEDGEGFATVDELFANLIIIDEASMIDVFVASKLFEVIPDECRVVIVGDPDQLPSVGAGQFLRDVIQSQALPVTKLRTIFRQSGTSPIILNSHRILEGNTKLDQSRGFYIKEENTELGMLKSGCQLYISCVKKYGIDAVSLLTPYRNKTDVSVNSFNKQLQHFLNPPKNEREIKAHNSVFRKGDKVMQVKNTERAKNGDIGYILDIKLVRDPESGTFKEKCVIEFNNDGEEFEYSVDDLKNVELAYASTVHKSQGSEFKTVIIIMSESHELALKRNLIYTAVTRAQENVAIIGQRSALEKAILNNDDDKRETYLCRFITDAFSEGGSDHNESNCTEQTPKWEQISIA